MKFDLHVHTTLSSCSQLTLEEILAHARSSGLDGVCITDHQTMDAASEVRDGIQADGLCVIVGMEYSTPEGDFLLFGPFDDLAEGLAAPDLLRFVDALGGIAVAAHPFRKGRSTARKIIAGRHCRVIEGRNGRDNGIGHKMAREWQRMYNVHLVGGSDAHTLEELGTTVTVFVDNIGDRNDFIKALRSGRYHPE